MVTFSQSQVEAHLARQAVAKAQPAGEDAVTYHEANLHEQIRNHCCKQWPPWKYLEFRMDKPAPLTGVQDFTIWSTYGRVFNIECKTRTGKQSAAQIVWQHELELLGHAYHVVRSFKEFMEAVKQ